MGESLGFLLALSITAGIVYAARRRPSARRDRDINERIAYGQHVARVAALEHDTEVRPCSAATSEDGRCWWSGCPMNAGVAYRNVESLALFMTINEIRALPLRDPRLTKEVKR